MIKYLLILFYLAIAFNSFGQKFIEGVVLDNNSSEPLIGANIDLCGQLSITDISGTYEVEITDDDNCVFKVSYIGYESQLLTIAQILQSRGVIRMELSNHLLTTAVVTGSKYEQSVSQSTVSIEVISPDFIEAQGKSTLEDVIDKIPGVQIIDNQANIRGGSGWSYGAGSRVMLLLDGIPILQPDAGFPNWNDLPIENIGQIEILKGAGSALYGSSAMNGVINIKTQYAKSIPETEIGLGYSQYLNPPDSIEKWWGDTVRYNYTVSFAHRQKFGKLDLVLGGFTFKEESFQEKTSDDYSRGNIRLRYRLNDRINFGVYSNINKGKSSSYFYWADEASYRGSAAVNISKNKKLRYNIDPFINYRTINGASHKLSGRFYGMNNENTDNQSTQANMNYGEYQFQKKFSDLDLMLTIGTVFSNSSIEAELYGDTTFVLKNFATYLQVDKSIQEKLILSFGVRYEYNTTLFPSERFLDTIYNDKIQEGLPVFRMGANYSISKATFLRASWGQGYRYPTIAEQFINTSAGSINVVPNVNLKSESGWTAELGIKQGYKIGRLLGFVDGGLFWSEYDKMIEFGAVVVNGSQLAFQAQNVGGTVIKGIDVSTLGQLVRGDLIVNYLMGYTFVDPKFKEYDSTGFGENVVNPLLSVGQANAAKSTFDGNVLKYRSKHQFKSDVEFSFKGISLGANYSFTSNMLAIDRVFDVIIKGVNTFRNKYNTGYGLLSLRMGYSFGNYKLNFHLNNATNTAYSVRPGLLEAPRNMSVRLNAKF